MVVTLELVALADQDLLDRRMAPILVELHLVELDLLLLHLKVE